MALVAIAFCVMIVMVIGSVSSCCNEQRRASTIETIHEKSYPNWGKDGKTLIPRDCGNCHDPQETKPVTPGKDWTPKGK